MIVAPSSIVPGWNVNDISFTVEFDPENMHYMGYDTSGTMLEGATITQDYQPGIVSYTISSATNIAGGGRLLKINFQPMEPGNYNFNVANFQYENTAVTAVTSTSIDVSSLVDEPQNSVIDLMNAMNITYQQVATVPMTTTFVLPSWDIQHATFRIQYQPDKLSWEGIDQSGTISESANVSVTFPASGNILFDIDFVTGVMWGSGNLLKLMFRAIGNTDHTTVAILEPVDFYFDNIAVQNLNPGYVVLLPTTSNDDNELSATMRLTAYPNPFNTGTQISYSLPKGDKPVVSIYNLKGEKVYSAVTQSDALGSGTITWDGRDSHNNPVPAGVYFLKVQTGSRQLVRKLLKL